MKRSSVGFLMVLALLLMGSVSLAAQPAAEKRESGERDQIRTDEEVAKLRLASSQYAIIQVLLDEGSFSEISTEFDQILGLGLSGPDQALVVKAAWNIVERLRASRQYAVAHKVVRSTLEWVEEVYQFELLMLQGKIYQDQRKFEEALRSLRRARSLQNLPR